MSNNNIVRLSPRNFKALQKALGGPLRPNEALRRLLHNETVLDRILGVPAFPATAESDADPRNPKRTA